jgi:hypothetical protein
MQKTVVAFSLKIYIEHLSAFLMEKPNLWFLCDKFRRKNVENRTLKYFLIVHFYVFSRFLSHLISDLNKYKRYFNTFNCYELLRHGTEI